MKTQSHANVPFPLPYIAITFGFAWLFWLPAVLATRGLVALPWPNVVLVVIGAHGPFVAALGLTYRDTGIAGVKHLLMRGFDVRLPLRWLIAILGLPIMLAGVAVALSTSTGGYRPALTLLSQPLLIVPTFGFLFFLGGSVQEEFGWRGYMLCRLLARWNPLTASLVLGSIWGFWHLPLFHIAGVSQSFLPFWAFMVTTVALSILFTWLYVRTENKLFSALLFHTAFNASLSIFPPIEQRAGSDQHAFVYMMMLYVITAVTVVVWEREHWLRTDRTAQARLSI
jgi:membrane protease YdiL (CAAX protease family)